MNEYSSRGVGTFDGHQRVLQTGLRTSRVSPVQHMGVDGGLVGSVPMLAYTVA